MSTPQIIKNVPQHTGVEISDVSKGKYPIFCFKHLSDKSIKKSKDYKFFINFLMRLKKLSELGWDEIATSDRHSYGKEKIPISDIKPSLPSIVTPDITHLYAYRANSDNRPFLGIKNGNILQIIFIEADFGDIYYHK